MICPLDQQPCTGDHSNACRAVCESTMHTERQARQEWRNRREEALLHGLPWPPPEPCKTCKGERTIGGKTNFHYDYPMPCPDCSALMPRDRRGGVIDPTRSTA